MKQSLTHPRLSKSSGFTLVELLVVIGIIAILAGVLLSAGGSALKAAQRAKAANTASQIQTACLGYYTEYSVYPVPAKQPAGDYIILDTDAASWKNLLIALCGNIDPAAPATPVTSTVSNTRAIAFLSLKSSDLLNDAPKNPLPPDGNHLYFNIAMDNDYDGLLGTAGTSANQLPNFTTAVTGAPPPPTGSSTAGIAVWANCNGNLTTQNPGFWVHTY